MSSQRFRLLRSVPVAAALTFAFVLASTPLSAAGPIPPPPVELGLRSTTRHPTLDPEPGAVASARFRLELPEAGLLSLDLTLPGATQPEPALRLITLRPSNEGRTAATARILRHTASSLLVEVQEPTVVLVEVAALTPGQSLPAFKLRSAFREARVLLVNKDVDPWDDDLGGKKPPVPGSSHLDDDLCSPEEQDDHGDVPLCATPLYGAQTLRGVLHNDAGDDEDNFLVHLPRMAVLRMEALSDRPVQLVLRNRDGLVVATLRGGDTGDPLRLAQVLPAGSYFLEVEGDTGDDVSYSLTLLRPRRP